MRNLLFSAILLLVCSASIAQTGKEQSKIRVHFKNETKKDVWILLSYLPYTGELIPDDASSQNSWTTNGWFKASPGQKIYIADTYNDIFYFYATTSTNFWGNWKEWRGGNYFYFQGKEYGFRNIRMADTEKAYDAGNDLYDYTLRLVK